MNNTPIYLGGISILLIISSTLILIQYSNVLSLQTKIDQLNEVIVDRDILIIQLDNAINLAKSILKLKSPRDSQYLMFPHQNNSEEITKIFLINTSVCYTYNPKYPFKTPWFNDSNRYFSSQREFELTNNRSIVLSFWGWWFNNGEIFEAVSGGETPTLNIAVMVRNDYTSDDAGGFVGNRTGNYFSSVKLDIRFYNKTGSVIEIPRNTNVPAPTVSSNTKMGGVNFLLESGQIEKVIFYLSPSVIEIETIEYYEIYVSSLSAY